MTIDKELFQKFDEYLVKPELFLDDIWYQDMVGGYVHWNSQGNVEDLLNGDGETFSEDSYGDPITVDGYVLFMLSDSCGGKGQVIFKLSNNTINPEDYA